MLLEGRTAVPREYGEVRGCSWPHEGRGQSSLTHRKKIAQGLIAVVCKLVSLSTCICIYLLTYLPTYIEIKYVWQNDSNRNPGEGY